MKKTILIMASLVLSSIFANAEQGMIVKKDGKRIQCDIINVDATGTIEYSEDNFKSKLKPGEYIFAKVAKAPDAYTNGEKLAKAGKYDEAIAAFDNILSSKYKFLGYEIPSLYWKAFCLEKLNRLDDAVKILSLMQKPADKSLEKDFFSGKKLLASIYIKQNKNDLAFPILTELGNSNDDSLAAFSFNARGEILKLQGKKKDAVLKYMITALLFPKNLPERAESLKNIIALLKEMNDTGRASKFEEMLKADFPDQAK